MAKIFLLAAVVLFLASLTLSAPAEEKPIETEKDLTAGNDDLKTDATHWGGWGHYGGLGHYGHHYGGYYPSYSYWGYPGYGYGYWPHGGYYGHHGYWW